MKKRLDVKNKDVYDLYFKQKLSCNKVASILKCDRSTVKDRIKNMGLSVRNWSMSEHVSKGMEVNVDLSMDFIHRIEGEMLGDGCLNPVKKQAYYSHSTAIYRKEYLEWLKSVFDENGIPTAKISERRDKPEYQFRSLSIKPFMYMFRNWYIPNENYVKTSRLFKHRKYIKSPPVDLIITPKTLLHWYIGDGKQTNGIILATCGFSKQAVEFLRYRLLEDLNIVSSRTTDNCIRIPKWCAIEVLDMIGSSPVRCYDYKWNMSPSIKPRNINDYINMKLVREYIIKGAKWI